MSENKKNIPKRRFKQFQNTDAWEQRKLGELFKYEQPQPYIVESTEYDDKYKIPVLTAGQSFILGYTDECFGIKNANEEAPVVIFDDFTTSSHYVDFPFKVKSSAMKLLSLNNKSDDIYCAFNVLQNIKYIPVSHERHWISKFAKFDVLMPSSKEEQHLIGDFFQELTNLITLHQRKLEKIQALKKAYLSEMFPAEGERKPRRRFAGFTDDWEQRKLKDISDFITKGATPTTYGFNWEEDGIPFFRNDSIKDNRFVFGEYSYISEETNTALIRSEIRCDDILVAITGDIGKVGIVPKSIEKANINQHMAKVRILKDAYPYFVYQYLSTDEMQKKYQKIKTGLSMPQLSLEQIRDTMVKLPSIEEQKKIGDYFFDIDNLITLHQRKLEKLQNIKKAYLNEMFI